MSQLVIISCLLLLGSTAAAATLIEDRADALAYVDEAFAGNDCRFGREAFFEQMVIDGVAPGVDDMSMPMDGSEKIIRQRRVLAVMEQLFADGMICEDVDDRTIAISKFGGCA